jgi:hypothetical protein
MVEHFPMSFQSTALKWEGHHISPEYRRKYFLGACIIATREDCGLRLAGTNSSHDLISKIIRAKWAGGVA